jgi:type 1 glutamine amidotransferase
MTRHFRRRSYREGRVFHTALGHRDGIWSNDAVFQAHIKGGIRRALGLE